MKKIFGLFRIKKEERLSALIAFIYVLAVNAIPIVSYGRKFIRPANDYHRWIWYSFHVFGFDPYTYEVVSRWAPDYSIMRHPLLAYFMYVPSVINKWLMDLTGLNFMQWIVGVLMAFCGFYSFVFLRRMLHEVVGVKAIDATLLGFLFYSFAYVILTMMVPDHFVYSMLMLLLTLYVCGKRQQTGRQLTIWQTIVFFFFTAGTSLSNGVKTYLAALFTNGKRFFRPRYLLLAVIVPCSLMWATGRLEYRAYQYPKDMKIKETAKKNHEKLIAQARQTVMGTTTTQDTARIHAMVKEIVAKKEKAKQDALNKKPWRTNHGRPFGTKGFLAWTDGTLSRWQSAVENLFGESIQIHQRYTLRDANINRPVFVEYTGVYNYIIEAVVVLLFAAGIWCGRRSRFFWMVFSFFAFDMLLHMGLGFGLNEVYIMTAHWIYVIPVSIAYLLLRCKGKSLKALRTLLLLLTAYLFVYNGYHIINVMPHL